MKPVDILINYIYWEKSSKSTTSVWKQPITYVQELKYFNLWNIEIDQPKNMAIQIYQKGIKFHFSIYPQNIFK